MNVSKWVSSITLESPITEQVLLLFGRNGITNSPIGSAVFIAPRLAITVKHVIAEFWRLYGTPDVGLEDKGDKNAEFEILAIQYPGAEAHPAVWITRRAWLSPHSDLAVITLEPADELSKDYQFTQVPTLSVLPPSKGEQIRACGFAASQVSGINGNRVELLLNPLSAAGPVTETYPSHRDRGLLSFPCFEIETVFIGGMSGGPIYNASNEICGLVCVGMNDYPSAHGVVLWPLFGVAIDQEIPSLTLTEPYPIAHLADRGFFRLKDWDQVAGNTEIVEEAFAKPRLRLKS